jgi:pimeloyl-ACP methyl ester carboxylesterase
MEPPLPIEPFHAECAQSELDDLKRRLERPRLPDQIAGSGWDYGTDRAVLEEWIGYWREEFDWRAVEARFNAFEQGISIAEGERVHFVHARSPEPNATPLLITHGWPGSVVEFLDVIEPLRDPVAHGGRPEDAFHVVCPHIPGYGFSGPTRQPGFHVHRAADAIADLMQQLGYDRYVAQGGDWGAIITRHLAEAHADRLIGAHFNMLFAMPDDLAAPDTWDGVTPAELEAFGRSAGRMADGTGYSEIQGTKPQTLAYGLHDSPVALLAWQLEKFHVWSDAGLEVAYSKDQVLANITLYWLTDTSNSSARLYCESKRAGNYAADPWSGTIEVPVGHCRYPGELLQTPRAWAERRYRNIVHWTEADRGGHFAAFENPDFFVEDLRAFGRALKSHSGAEAPGEG